MIVRIVSALFAFSFTATAWAQSVPVPSTWVNQNGSILTISANDPQKGLDGKFTNKKQNTYCRDIAEDIDGAVSGNKITFATTFGKTCETVTIWNGTISGSKIIAKWTYKYFSIDNKNHGKFATVSGTDTFTKQ